MKYNIDYSGIPDHMRKGVKLYLEHRIEPGSFLLSVLENKLVASFLLADEINLNQMRGWVKFLTEQMPSVSWGSVREVNKWLKGE